ncbi:hypothetical protein [Burkholderia sp. LMG 21824]|uniref:hypothetical protein n=1 Tax=Burkholderia sp. LMG 21824 TaxID=3158172 RepID=UPI003C2F5B30
MLNEHDAVGTGRRRIAGVTIAGASRVAEMVLVGRCPFRPKARSRLTARTLDEHQGLA